MELLLGVLAGLLILMILVALHELGHAIAAVKSGVVVQEFGIGFPPKAWAKKLKNGTLFSLNWLPLGGFVRFQGEFDSADKEGDYGAASYLQKTLILLAGVAVNWLVAAILLSVLALTSGIPHILPNQFFAQSGADNPVTVAHVSEESPAEVAGIKPGDVILEIDGVSVPTAFDLTVMTKDHQGETVSVEYQRNGASRSAEVQLLSGEEAVDKGFLGVAAHRQFIKAGWQAPMVGVATTAQYSWATLVGVKDLAVNTSKGVVQKFSSDESRREQASQNLSQAADSVAGPIGILGVIFPAAAQAGLSDLVFLTAIISLTLAVMNILPIPALDGGRWLIMTVFRVIKQPLTKEREEAIQGTGFLVLIGLIIVVTIADIGKIF